MGSRTSDSTCKDTTFPNVSAGTLNAPAKEQFSAFRYRTTPDDRYLAVGTNRTSSHIELHNDIAPTLQTIWIIPRGNQLSYEPPQEY